MFFDAAVIGAGPAGSLCAYTLAAQGLSVAVIEKEFFPRAKTCGGGVTERAWRLLPFSADQTVDHVCSEVRITLPRAGLAFSVQRETPLIRTLSRERFDDECAKAAAHQGAHFRFGTPVTGLRLEKEHVVLALGPECLSARTVVACDGALGQTATLAGFPCSRPMLIPACKWEIPLPPETIQGLCPVPRFDLGVVPHGYGWIFPKKAGLSAGVLSHHPRLAQLQKGLKAYLADAAIPFSPAIRKSAHPIPVKPHSPAWHGPVLLAGDAWGGVDPLTAEGLFSAMQSGCLAAQAIIDNRDTPEKIGCAYEQSLKAFLIPDINASAWLAKLLYRSAHPPAFLFKTAGQTLCERVADVFEGKRRWSEEIRKTRNYLGLLKGPLFGLLKGR